MLCQFSFQNFKSFKDEAFLDLMAESIKDNKYSIIIDKKDGERFLPVIAIYGPNGGGKSTVLEALNYLRTVVLQTVVISQMQGQDEKYSSIIKKYTEDLNNDKYHKFDSQCSELPICFDIMFRTTNNQYRYQLSMKHHVIVEENLYAQVIGDKNATVVFERTSDECILGDDLDGITVEKVKNTMPLISHIAINYDISIIDEAISWFLDISFVNYDNSRKERRILIPKSKRNKEKMFEMLQRMDIPIKDVRVEKDIDGNIKNIYTRHILQNGETYEILFEEESSGTRKLFSCLSEIINCLEKGNLMVADELDAKLHPKLLQYIIELFTDPKSNRHGAQLLLTSHDITTMTAEIFRRDEIWFCARNPQNASNLYSLISFRKENGQPPRSDEVYGKRYIEGHYGADPYIRKILDWGNME